MAVAAIHAGGIADHIHPEPQGFVRRYVFSLDHKIIGIQYFITGFVFFMLAGLARRGDSHAAAQSQRRLRRRRHVQRGLHVHGSAMVWLVIIPLLTGGFGNFVLPLQIGARDVAFPWLNMLSFWIFPVAGLDAVLVVPDGRADRRLDGVSADLAARRGRHVDVGRGDLPGRRQLDADRHQLPRHDLQDARARHDVHAHAALRLGTVRDRAAADDRDDGARGRAAALFIERQFGVPFFDPTKGGSPVLWQHMFWFYSHPAVYIMILPAFGIISEVLPTFARKPIFGYKMIAFSSMAIALPASWSGRITCSRRASRRSCSCRS